ncbi:hypothetical protein FFLO_01724 [Filobasidium floriforme]|uniref:Major facilitator superfamily (MFS) profile domain-containing protein n=1 Tax=Filobasidium floriforme TaxID=5210 RepID=A0A8K0NSK7_9TREE|nr:major facilitator superfamily domain-containing protein [Filobasidium floriforme]KAG7562895.1 hypothetical protein FFLO_01724 [Filobasidium floriforme]KAH8086412.1 major facilitator superfamily domain-containing protein [Filobasidium floriforme]
MDNNKMGKIEDDVPTSLDPDEPAQPDREIVLQDQSIRLPLSRLLMIYFGIGLALILSFMDQTSVSTAAPVIGTDIGGSDSITWVGTSFLVANCAMHLVYGRLSDIFGRKLMLQLALLFLGFGNLLCGFAKTPIQLYCFRAISGLGGGGINGIAMTVVSDVVSLKDRGKYQGLISAATSIGNSIGPFAGGGLATAGQWRWVFWMTCPLSVLIAISTHFILPLKPVVGSVKTKLRQIDYTGIILGAGATVLLLVPISGGGSAFAWNSSTVIALLVVGGAMLVGFLCSQWKLSRLPILPLRLFRTPSVSILLMQSFLIGFIYYGNIFYVPMYFQYVKGYTALKSGALVLAYTLPQAFWGVLGGQIISRTNRYKAVIIFGSCMWTLSSGLQLLWGRTTTLGKVIGILQVNSLGVGWCLQTTLVAMMAVTPDKDRAVVTASRNFFRTMGGAFGLAGDLEMSTPSTAYQRIFVS